MKINEKLSEAANANPTKETRQFTIFDLCKSVDQGTLTLPLYQRDLSWTLKKYVALYNYQLLGKAPVSAISINEIKNVEIAVPQVTFIDRNDIEVKENLLSVVDGQQRITTNYKAYAGSDDVKDIVLDLKKGKFILLKEKTLPSTYQIPVGILLNKDDQKFFDYLNKHKSLNKNDVKNVLLQIKTKIKSYYYTINQAQDLTEDEQIQWFEVLNNAGSRVSAIQMRLAKLKVYGIDIYKDYTHLYIEKIKSHGYDEVFLAQTTNVSYPISALNPAYEIVTEQEHSNNYCPMAPDVKENQICNLKPEQITTCFKLTLKALDKALSFIDEYNLKHPKRIDYINFLLGYFVFHNNELTESDRTYLTNWYNSVDFTNTTNTMRRKIFTDLISTTH